MSLEALADALSLMKDRQEILALASSFIIHADLREWDLLTACYTESVDWNYKAVVGGSSAKRVELRELVPYLRSVARGWDATQHSISNVQVVYQDAHTAKTRSHVTATHRIDKDVWVCGGMYHLDLLRSESRRWLISGQTVDILYETGDRTVFDRALAQGLPAPF